MSAPRQSTKEWLPEQNAYQRAVWTVFVHHEIKDYAEFLEKLRVDWDDFEKELEAACEQRTAAVDIPLAVFRLHCRGRCVCPAAWHTSS